MKITIETENGKEVVELTEPHLEACKNAASAIQSVAKALESVDWNGLIKSQKKIEAGKWYTDGLWVIYVKEIKPDVIVACGFDHDDRWMHVGHFYSGNIDLACRSLKEADKKYVEELLLKEAEKRFGKDWPNARIKGHANDTTTEPNTGEYCFHCTVETIFNNNGVIYSCGVWAEREDFNVYTWYSFTYKGVSYVLMYLGNNVGVGFQGSVFCYNIHISDEIRSRASWKMANMRTVEELIISEAANTIDFKKALELLKIDDIKL